MNSAISFLAPGLAAVSATPALSVADTYDAARVVSFDLRQACGPLNAQFKRCVGAGRANEVSPSGK